MKKNDPYIQYIWYLPIVIACIIYFLVYKYNYEHPKIEWDTSPDNVVISYEIFAELDYGYIPDFRVWGDGHIVWVQYDLNKTRKVYEGYLSQNELKDLINQFAKAGFYNLFGNDNSTSININIALLTTSRQSSINANTKISQLADFLKSGAGTKASEFIPKTGYLFVFPIQETEYKYSKITPMQWPEDKYNITFENFDKSFPEGQEFKGDELNFIWQTVNHSSVVEVNGKVYWIALEIPKISY